MFYENLCDVYMFRYTIEKKKAEYATIMMVIQDDGRFTGSFLQIDLTIKGK